MSAAERAQERGPSVAGRLMYDAIFALFALAYLPAFFAKGKHRRGWGERFGRVPEAARAALAGSRRLFWVHAVSVGEVALAVRLSAALRRKFAGAKVLLTVSTETGWEVARRSKAAEDVLLRFPVDFRGCVRSFADAVGPVSALVLLETEIWPNLIFEMRGRGTPVFIMNGRISDKALGQYRFARPLLGTVLGALSGVGAQDEAMRARFVSIGVPAARVHVTGNIKFDWRPSAEISAEARALERRLKAAGDFLCIAGSTHEGEEEMLFDMYRALRGREGRFRLLIAPRHLDRLGAVEAAAASRNLTVRRTSVPAGEDPATDDAVWLLDRMGILSSLYAAADAVFVGGSLVPAGGHNLVEPAFHEKPLFFGPYMQNFREMAEVFTRARAAVQVADAAGLERALRDLVNDRAAARALGTAAKRLIFEHQGATERNLETLLAPLVT